MQPQCKITIDGKLASGVFMDRLTSCEVSDQEGAASDTVSIELNDHPPAAIPRKGAIIRVWMGYSAGTLTFMGAFTVDQVRVTAFPHTMSISGKSDDFKSDAKTPKSRHWDDKSIKDIVGEIAGDLGLSAKVDEAIGAFTYPWLAQEGESALELVYRLAERHDALLSIKDGKLVFAAKGSGKNAAGAALTPVVVTPQILIEGSTTITFADRSEVDSVEASWYDRAEARLKKVEETVNDLAE